ncbi:MAG: phage terminase small subunit P27 family [Acidobacteriota bacterium]
MGQRGPAPKPTALRIAEGNLGKRPLNILEPRPRQITPACPKHLDGEGRLAWRRLVPVLERMRVLTEADGIVLANLCDSYSTMVQAQRKLRETGMLLKTPSGYVQQNPLISIVNTCMETVTRLAREFGLTPTSRTRLHAGPENGPLSKTRQLLELVNGPWRGQ